MGFNKFVVVALFLVGLTLTPHCLAHNLNSAYTFPGVYLAEHNSVRAEVGVSPLVWNTTLADYAQNYLNSKVESCEMVHSNGPYGENLAQGFGDYFGGVEAVRLWAEEKPNFDYESNTCIGGAQCLHYTQIVWKNTHQIGCASVKCNNQWNLISCNYYPPGNYIGERPY